MTKQTRQELKEMDLRLKIRQTRKELEKTNLKIFWIGVFGMLVMLGIVFMVVVERNNLKQELQFYQNQIPEVVSGNLYIGYEDGVRIGYHQDYLNKSIWYRCARDCEVIK